MNNYNNSFFWSIVHRHKKACPTCHAPCDPEDLGEVNDVIKRFSMHIFPELYQARVLEGALAHTNKQTYIHTYIHTCMHDRTCTRIDIHTQMHINVFDILLWKMRGRSHQIVSRSISTTALHFQDRRFHFVCLSHGTHTHTHTYTHTYTHAYILNICWHASSYIFSYIH